MGEQSPNMTFPPDPADRDPLLPVFMEALAAQRNRSITFVLVDNLGQCGLTNLDAGVVYLSAQNSYGEMRSTIAHELYHLLCPDDCTEDDIEARAAELLVPLSEALAAQARGDMVAAAEQLGVDTALLRARLRGLDTGDQTAAG